LDELRHLQRLCVLHICPQAVVATTVTRDSAGGNVPMNTSSGDGREYTETRVLAAVRIRVSMPTPCQPLELSLSYPHTIYSLI
jgi:hypothetical protein